jgi:hypothetical protein
MDSLALKLAGDSAISRLSQVCFLKSLAFSIQEILNTFNYFDVYVGGNK